MSLPLWKHQQEAIERAKSRGSFALFFEPGTGKTRTMIEMLRHKYAENGAIFPTLIFCPPIVITNWKNEILKYSKIKEEKIIPLIGTGPQRLKILQASDRNSIFITNYETLLMEPVFNEMKKLGHVEPGVLPPLTCLILDESHKCKDTKASRTKRMIALSKFFDYRFLLTGTPILNNLMDIFSQYQIMDGGKTFGDNFFSFRARYFEDRNKSMPRDRYFPNWQLIRGSEARVKDLIEDSSMTVEKSECLDLPPLVKKTIEVPLGKEQARMYRAMKEDLIATVTGDDGRTRASIAELAITKALRLQQIVSGHIKVVDDEGGATTIKIKDNPRREALKELLSEIAPYHKVLVWAVFKDNYDDIRDVCGSLGLDFTELHGEVKDKDAAVDRFSNDPQCRVLIGHPGSGGIGVNLVSASYSIFYSRSFSLEFDIQAEARNYRGGSERHESITRIDLIACGTIDQLVAESLASKIALSDKILKENLEKL